MGYRGENATRKTLAFVTSLAISLDEAIRARAKFGLTADQSVRSHCYRRNLVIRNAPDFKLMHSPRGTRSLGARMMYVR